MAVNAHPRAPIRISDVHDLRIAVEGKRSSVAVAMVTISELLDFVVEILTKWQRKLKPSLRMEDDEARLVSM